jgi:hypothetical protein
MEIYQTTNKKIKTMKTLNFLILISLIAVIIILNNRVGKAKEIIKDNEEIISLQDSLINSIQGNSKKYIDIALKCNAKHK